MEVGIYNTSVPLYRPVHHPIEGAVSTPYRLLQPYIDQCTTITGSLYLYIDTIKGTALSLRFLMELVWYD